MIATLAAWHARHEDAARALAGVTALPSHVAIEAYSVLTRMPAGLAVAPGDAVAVLRRRFPDQSLTLGAKDRRRLVERLAEAGVFGGATYDGLVALEAHAGGRRLLTLDRRAQETYRRLGVAFDAL